MKFPVFLPVIAISATFLPAAFAGDGVVDLTNLANYANQSKPAYITKDNTPPNDAITDRGATLGRVLFYDKRLSRDNTIACSSCHRQSHAFGDGSNPSTGVSGTTGRHTPRLVNARFGTEPRFFWDERATNLENQATQPIRNHVEMGFSGTSGDPAFADLVTKLSAISEYRVLFAMAFGDSTITETRIQRALAQFVRSIQSFDSRFDVGRAAVNANNVAFPNFTQQENNGKQLFLAPPGAPGGGAGCGGCHRAPEFDIDPASLNNGVITQIGGGTDLTNTRAPSLRDLIGPDGLVNGPLMHDGSFATLDQVVAHYNAIPGDNANLDPRLRRPGGQVQNLGLTPQQRDSIVAFLRTLTGSAVYTDARWSDPFDASGNLSLVVLPSSSVSISNHGDGTATISCVGVPGLPYRLEQSTGLGGWTTVATIAPDPNGVCDRVVPVAGGTFYRFAYYVPAP